MLTVANFREGRAGESACDSRHVSKVVGGLEEGFALMADAANGHACGDNNFLGTLGPLMFLPDVGDGSEAISE